MKLKAIPTDFVVEESLSLELRDSGPFRIYKLEKTHMDTQVAVNHIAKACGISASVIGVSGLKDKHAKTIQYISVPEHISIGHLNQPKLAVSLEGFSTTPITIGSHDTNTFTITVRELRVGSIAEWKTRAEQVFAGGIPNYYDSQRFGSVLEGVFLGKLVLEKNFEEAIKLYCTAIRKTDLAFVKADKRALLAAWPTLTSVKVTDRVLKDIAMTYTMRGAQLAYERIPIFERKMHVQAYASFIWNEALKLTLKQARLYKPFSVPYAAGSLLLGIPKPAGTHVDPKLLHDVLLIEQAPSSALEWIDSKRLSWIGMTNASIVEIASDELASRVDQMQKMTLKFTLPAGSYATIVLKAIFRK